MDNKNREVSIGICGAIVGVLLGAGSVVYSQDVSGSLVGSLFTDSSTYGYLNAKFEDAYRKRSLNLQEKRELANVPVQLSEEEQAACFTKVRITEELRSAIMPLIPGRPIDDIVRSAMTHVFDEYIANCTQVQSEVIEALEQVDEPVHAAPAAEPEEVGEDLNADTSPCDKFIGSGRFGTCVEAIRKGIDYQP